MKMVFVLKFTGEGNGICALSFCVFRDTERPARGADAETQAPERRLGRQE